MERTNKAHNLLHEVGERGTMKSLLLAQEATGKARVKLQENHHINNSTKNN